MDVAPIDLKQLCVFPLATRKSLTRADDIPIDPASTPPPVDSRAADSIERCAEAIRAARARGAAVMLIYGAHLLRNGAAPLIGSLLDQKLLTHLATNGAGTIHDWEYAWLGASTESVRENVATGTFGTWDETGRNIHLALMTGALDGLGYGRSLGRFITQNGTRIPTQEELVTRIQADPTHRLTAARATLLRAIVEHSLPAGEYRVVHRWPNASIVSLAYRHGVPLTVHPGIGHDIITNHPMFDGSVIGRAGGLDFELFAGSVERLDGGVVLSIGSAIMGPQVFEKALSCVNNLRLKERRPIVRDHSFFVVDLQDGGGWDWNQGEPPKSNPAYYLRFCKSYSRMGGPLHYVSCDNAAFLHNLHQALVEPS